MDDDPLSNRLVVAALQRAHLQARSTDDPMVGLQWLKESRFDLVLLDIEMPGMDGFELCRRLRTLPGYQKTPVIYVTSHSDFEQPRQGRLERRRRPDLQTGLPHGTGRQSGDPLAEAPDGALTLRVPRGLRACFRVRHQLRCTAS